MGDYMNNIRLKKYLIFLTVALSVLAVGYLVIGWYLSELFQDGYTRWKESAYLLRGVDPLDIVMRRHDFISEIGKIPKTAATMPWTYVLNNLFSPGFLPWAIAKPITIFIYFFVQLLACIAIYKYLLKKISADKKYIIWFAIAAFLASYAILSGLKWGNNALVVSALLVIAICMDKDKHPFLVGLCLGFSMIKPQMAFLFFIPFLIDKRFKIIFTGAAVVLTGWIIASILANTNPLVMLLQNYQQGTGLPETSRYVYNGLFDFLILKGLSVSYVLLPQMFLFTALSLFLSYKYRNANQLALFSIPAVFSSMWMYSHAFDLQIVNVVVLTIIFLLYLKKDISMKMFFTGCLLMCSVLLPIPQQWYESSSLIPLFQRCIFLIALAYVLINAKQEQNKTVLQKG